ncbi:anhydro-N-acetylmuramic acid kinase [Corallincola holothuriorum]|uniref:Anhydro-N-acetylmuramic acid kinase n=1 Tax=Corallincola holothuriorum TaxID=2282215 RepID=A0A368NM46_9GAMM|nr:anhydro-N-acetylmuramic acid kinase [Corallincola holothuriorum]RCU51627.1 anhydro-N-acetylmuramic acid kinase [Corallincola holothuriorum]
MAGYYIGLMSGTSMDGIDAVLVDFSQPQPAILASHQHPLPEQLVSGLHQLCQPAANEINRLGAMDRELGQLFAEAVNALLAKTDIPASEITAIGSHGQTVRHHPHSCKGFTLQLGDANTIAVETGIDVVADFRRKDIALGGQGAPLVPAFHHALLASPECDRVILNIGGVANITWLPATDHTVLGFDTGPGNTLMDQWCLKHQGKPYDNNGEWGATGTVSKPLLKQLLSEDYFELPAPKSTGRELFNLSWLQHRLDTFSALPPQDVQATLCALTVHSIAEQIAQLPLADNKQRAELWICGGGARNAQLVSGLQQALPQLSVAPLDALGVSADDLEALAFAWLAYRHINRLPGNLPAVTGASRPAILGALFPAG